MSTTPITIQAAIHAPDASVWHCYTQPQHITQWNQASPDWHCPSATNDMRIGGRYVARMEARDGSMGFDFEAIYDAIEEGKQFTYTMTDGRRATVQFTPDGMQTVVTVTFDPEQTHPLDMQREGWQAILNNFKAYCEGLQSQGLSKLEYSIGIKAPAAKVFDTMLGLSQPTTYNAWTVVFNPHSHYKGKWEQGQTIRFLGCDENGKVGGMLSQIAELIPDSFVSICHIGMIDGDIEITEGPQVDGWKGALENYRFTEDAATGTTTVAVSIDTASTWKEYFDTTWPKALAVLKDNCEQ